MMHVVVGSTNEGKVDACRRAFASAFGEVEIRSVDVPSGVAAQPVGDECFDGARNRAGAARGLLPGDFFVGIEGGMLDLYGRWFGFSVACVIDAHGCTGYGTSPLYPMPPGFARCVLEGTELGDVVTKVTGDPTYAERRGIIGLLTRELLTRERAHECGVLAALARHLSAERYEE